MGEPEAAHAESRLRVQSEALEVVPDAHPITVDELSAPLNRQSSKAENRCGCALPGVFGPRGSGR